MKAPPCADKDGAMDYFAKRATANDRTSDVHL